jgi:IclR family transcriptional regulator, KDG regulon repressor
MMFLDRTERLINILSYIASTGKPCGVTEISKNLSIDKTSVSRILSTLAKLDWLVQSPDSAYTLSVKPLEFALAVISGIDIKSVSHTNLVVLNKTTRETAALLVPAGLDYILVDEVECSLPLRYVFQLGSRTPLWFGAPGKAILAFMDPSELEEVITKIKKAETRFPASDKLLDIDQMLAELGEVRRQGFTASTGELSRVAMAVASPIFDRHDKVAGSIIITGPTSRINKKNSHHFGVLVKQTANNISAQLGSNFRLP